MSRFAVYSLSTNKVLRIVECPDAWAGMQASEGEGVLPASSDVTTDGFTHADGQLIAVSPLPPTEAEIRATLTGLAQQHLDTTARAWGYDSILSAMSYVGDPYARFAAEGLALRNWRSAVWAWLDAAQTQPLPDPIPTEAEFIAMLPAVPIRPSV